MKPQIALVLLIFCIADVQDGLGPFFGVFLKEHGFLEGEIGIISTFASLCALIFGVPLGILIDKTRYKRLLVGICISIICLATFGLLLYQHFIFAMFGQFAIAMSGALLAPAFASITLGIVGIEKYNQQTSKNEAFRHGGQLFGAILCFIFALYYGITSVFIITILMGMCAFIFLNLIKESSINHTVARGEVVGTQKVPLRKIFSNPNILILAFSVFCFHLSNAYMLPLLSQRAHSMGVDSSGAYAAATVIIAQSTMIFVCITCGKLIKKHKTFKIYFLLMALCLFELVIRGGIAASFSSIPGMVVVQILDGIGAGLIGILVPVLCAFILQGSGHFNAGFAFVMTCWGIGAALSGSLGGIIAQKLGYFYAYGALALAAFIGLVVWILCFNRLNRSIKPY
ncbi:MFS transporter [Helicobacter sp. 16-1353]|uniref:MFS transporter n=1 Tax=Helicobacter sp. 16-1353 TaxID=2004996 RepID=UPI000DCD4335|nr:MFS transporter [Helicobacter sp. 16-1353]RAX52459.1 MFS transporter [Helicobacter sp. 16-1353]